MLKHFPLEGECNPYAPNGGHMRRVRSRGGGGHGAPEGQGRQQMEDWLFDNQDHADAVEVREAAQDVGGIADFDGAYAKALEEVKADAESGRRRSA